MLDQRRVFLRVDHTARSASIFLAWRTDFQRRISSPTSCGQGQHLPTNSDQRVPQPQFQPHRLRVRNCSFSISSWPQRELLKAMNPGTSPFLDSAAFYGSTLRQFGHLAADQITAQALLGSISPSLLSTLVVRARNGHCVLNIYGLTK